LVTGALTDKSAETVFTAWKNALDSVHGDMSAIQEQARFDSNRTLRDSSFLFCRLRTVVA
jgi:hypothetical protein